jgi:predicted CoA-binding protein
MNKDEMLQLRNWAIIGVTPKKDRYGYKIWRQMKEKGYTVYGVNPNYEEIDG